MERRPALESSGLDGLLRADEREVMERVLLEEEARREHLVVYLSGAHAYGFPSPDSDLDLKAIHVAPTGDLVGLEVPPTTIDRAEVLDGVEIDYTSNELAHALAGILEGNGNFLERVLGRTVPHAGELLGELRPIVRRTLSRRVHRHYRGFAQNQLRFLEKEPTAKKLLYVLRTTLTGLHLLETGELEADLSRVMDRYGIADAAALIERKRAGERIGLDGALLDAWRPRVLSLLSRLDAARAASVLPEEPEAEAAADLRAWLVAVRRSRFR
jgi:predicted nucleotidyltransferase